MSITTVVVKAKRRVLAVAVDCENLAMSFFIDGKHKELRTSRQAARKESAARSALRIHIAEREVELVVFEAVAADTKKGRHSQLIIQALVQAAEDDGVAIMRVPQQASGQLSQLSIDALVERFPEAAHHLPSPRYYPHKQSKRQVVTEALAMAAMAFDHLDQADQTD